jgi:hypothetical protein
LKEPGSHGIELNGEVKDQCEAHSSIIVGKKMDNGKCLLFLKNTWNNPNICKKHPGGCIYRISRDPQFKTKYKEEVGLWVDENEILNNALSLTYIYPENKDELEIEEKWRRIEEKYDQAGKIFLKILKKVRNKNP